MRRRLEVVDAILGDDDVVLGHRWAQDSEELIEHATKQRQLGTALCRRRRLLCGRGSGELVLNIPTDAWSREPNPARVDLRVDAALHPVEHPVAAETGHKAARLALVRELRQSGPTSHMLMGHEIVDAFLGDDDVALVRAKEALEAVR